MNKKVINSIFIILIILVVIIIGSGASILSKRSKVVALEERIEAKYVSNQSNYDNMWKKFKEQVQITEMQADKIQSIYKDIVSGRTGDNNLLFKAIKEDNPKLNQEVYSSLQNDIVASRTSFSNNQTQLTDIIREYNTYIKKHFIIANILNRTPKNMKDYILLSEKTDKAFETKKADEIDLYKKGE